MNVATSDRNIDSRYRN